MYNIYIVLHNGIYSDWSPGTYSMYKLCWLSHADCTSYIFGLRQPKAIRLWQLVQPTAIDMSIMHQSTPQHIYHKFIFYLSNCKSTLLALRIWTK